MFWTDEKTKAQLHIQANVSLRDLLFILRDLGLHSVEAPWWSSRGVCDFVERYKTNDRVSKKLRCKWLRFS